MDKPLQTTEDDWKEYFLTTLDGRNELCYIFGQNLSLSDLRSCLDGPKAEGFVAAIRELISQPNLDPAFLLAGQFLHRAKGGCLETGIVQYFVELGLKADFSNSTLFKACLAFAQYGLNLTSHLPDDPHAQAFFAAEPEYAQEPSAIDLSVTEKGLQLSILLGMRTAGVGYFFGGG